MDKNISDGKINKSDPLPITNKKVSFNTPPKENTPIDTTVPIGYKNYMDSSDPAWNYDYTVTNAGESEEEDDGMEGVRLGALGSMTRSYIKGKAQKEAEKKAPRRTPTPRKSAPPNTTPIPPITKVSKAMAEQGRKIAMDYIEGLDADKKSKLLSDIDLYYQYFPFLMDLNGKKKVYNGKNSVEELESELQRCKISLSSREALTNAKLAHQALFKGISYVGVRVFRYPLGNLEAVAKSPEVEDMFDQELKELSIVYGHFLSSRVEFRYIFKVLSVVKRVYEINKGAMGAHSEGLAASEAGLEKLRNNKKYKDL
jgi:hypothetical protein